MDKLVTAIRSDGDFKGGIITVAGTCVTLSPYVALSFNVPVPDDVVWAIKMAGFMMLVSGTGLSMGYALVTLFYRPKHSKAAPISLNDTAKEHKDQGGDSKEVK